MGRSHLTQVTLFTYCSLLASDQRKPTANDSSLRRARGRAASSGKLYIHDINEVWRVGHMTCTFHTSQELYASFVPVDPFLFSLEFSLGGDYFLSDVRDYFNPLILSREQLMMSSLSSER